MDQGAEVHKLDNEGKAEARRKLMEIQQQVGRCLELFPLLYVDCMALMMTVACGCDVCLTGDCNDQPARTMIGWAACTAGLR